MKRLTFIALAITGLFVLAGGLQADTIELTDGKKFLRVKVVKEGLLKVEYKKPGLPTQYVDSIRVKDIKYDGTGQEYKTARETYDNGAFAEAAGLFRDVADNTSKAPFKAHCLYRAAVAFQKGGEYKTAVQAFTEFANATPDHRLYPDALQNRAICYLALGDTQKAEAAFALLKKKVEEKGLPEFWQLEAEYWATFMLERKSPDKAEAAFKDLYDRTKKNYPSIANKARLRIGRVYMRQRKYKQAFDLFDEIIQNRNPDSESEREIVAWAYLSRGNCVMNMPKKGDGKAEFKKALYDMLRVVHQYEDIGVTQAEAMYWAGKCFQQVGGKDATKHWQGLFRRLQRKWPGTSWAQEAAKEVAG